MFQNKRLFVGIAVVVLLIAATGTVLIATAKSTIRYGDTIPTSTFLSSLPPQTQDTPDSTSIITNLPLTISYTDTRNIQDTIGYLIDPSKSGVVYTGTYREGSAYTDNDGRSAFLIDVESVKKTFVVHDKYIVDCASDSQQKESTWHCTMPEGEEYE